jgi:hypothetical protein
MEAEAEEINGRAWIFINFCGVENGKYPIYEIH